ncbi:hypothetical protein [Falsiroseomonas sp.]|uniref:cell division protein FtsL n=1 Tax=Falsiroseomonas sp. TaxID=2870721 RepID=UPI0034A35B2F
MIRPFTLLCFCAFAGAGAWLYQVKHQVAMKDRELVEIRRQTEQARQRLDILRAEWALLNEPGRLRQNAMRVLSLEPMQPQHFVRPTDIERRLPAALAFAGAPDLFAPPTVAEPPRGAEPPVMLASAPAAARVGRAPAAATPTATPAGQGAAQGSEAPAPQALAAALAAQRAEHIGRVAPRAPAPQPALAPQPIQPAVPVTSPPRSVGPVTRVTSVAPPAPSFASALGGASALGRPTLAPPVPIGSANAATPAR